MNPASRFRGRNPLDPVNSAVELELAVDTVSVDPENDFLVAADSCLVVIENFGLPALPLREAGIHTEKVRREKSGFLSSRTSPDLHDDAFLIVGVLRQEEDLYLLFQLAEKGLLLRKFVPRKLGHVGIGTVHEAFCLLDVPGCLPVFTVFGHHGFELGVPSGKSLQFLQVAVGCGIGHFRFDGLKILFKSLEFPQVVHSDSSAGMFSFFPRAVSRDVRATSICRSSGSLVVRY